MKLKLPLIIVIIVVVILVIVAIFLGGEKNKEENGKINNSKNAEIANEIYGFTAEIKKIQDRTLTLEAQIAPVEENAELIQITAKAVVTDETKITKLIFPEEITDEPIFPEEIDMTFDDLRVGDKIDIGTTTNIYKNIKDETEFELNFIFIKE